MIKFAVTTFTIIVMLWLRFALDGSQNEGQLAIASVGSVAWLGTFGLYYSWKLLLLMVRQMGAAVRGQ